MHGLGPEVGLSWALGGDGPPVALGTILGTGRSTWALYWNSLKSGPYAQLACSCSMVEGGMEAQKLASRHEEAEWSCEFIWTPPCKHEGTRRHLHQPGHSSCPDEVLLVQGQPLHLDSQDEQ